MGHDREDTPDLPPWVHPSWSPPARFLANLFVLTGVFVTGAYLLFPEVVMFSVSLDSLRSKLR